MLRGLYTAGLGMTTQMNRMDVVSNNLANVNTTGFKKDTAVNTTFSDLLSKRTHDIEDMDKTPFAKKVGGITYGPYINEVYTDFTQGSFHTTSSEFDVSISGSGFFAVNMQDKNGNIKEVLTRDGAFTRTAEGFLVTEDGSRVQGQNGDINVGNSDMVISANGDILLNNEYYDTLKIKDYEDLRDLRKMGDNYLIATESAVEKEPNCEIIQGVLELSNVNTVREMVEMITVNRAYEANQKTILAIDSVLSRSVTEIGRKS